MLLHKPITHVHTFGYHHKQGPIHSISGPLSPSDFAVHLRTRWNFGGVLIEVGKLDELDQFYFGL